LDFGIGAIHHLTNTFVQLASVVVRGVIAVDRLSSNGTTTSTCARAARPEEADQPTGAASSAGQAAAIRSIFELSAATMGASIVFANAEVRQSSWFQ
jgi:hypothetical protein